MALDQLCPGTGKRRLTWPEARRTARRLRRQERTQGGRTVEAYVCRSCCWWHVGHAPFARLVDREAARDRRRART